MMLHSHLPVVETVYGDDYDPHAEPSGVPMPLDPVTRLTPAEQVAPLVLPRRVPPHFPGLRRFHDIRNERYALSAVKPVAAAFVPRTIHHRQYAHYDQGNTPECTGYGSVTLLSAAHPYNRPPLSGDAWYQRNVAEDRKQGRFFDGGATTVAAMEVGRQLGLYSEYRWLYTLTEMQQAILDRPFAVGTEWYPSMWERGRDGVVKMPGTYEPSAGGHFYILNGYDARRGLWRYPSTWGDGDYLIPDELVYRLIREGGEMAQPTELKIGPGYTLPQ